MKAVTFGAAIPRYLGTLAAGRISERLYIGPHACTRLQTVATPRLPGDTWVRIRTRLGGICGSDLGLVTLQAAPSLSPFSSHPFVIGHENVGDVVEVGRGVTTLAPGERVTANPILCCEPRNVRPVCGPCSEGQHQQCIHFVDGDLPPGAMLGTTRGLGGSWGDEFVAHESQVLRIPDGMTDAEAVLVEPLACSVHAVRSGRLRAGESALVIGAGTMGLLTAAALQALAPEVRVTVLARHLFQGEHASRLGAVRVVPARGNYTEDLADAAGARLLKPIIGERIATGGFDRTYVCTGGSRGVRDALRFTRSGGSVMLLGNASKLPGVDWSPVWFKELTIAGTLCYGTHPVSDGVHGHAPVSSFEEAARIIADGRAPVGGLVTHTFPLADYRRALATALDKGAERSVKVAFAFRG